MLFFCFFLLAANSVVELLRFLCAAHMNNTISIIEMDGLTLHASLQVGDSNAGLRTPTVSPIQEQIRCMAVSADNQFIACTVLNRVQIFKFGVEGLYRSFAIDSTVASVTFHPTGCLLVAIGVNKQPTVFDLQKQSVANWSVQHPHVPKMRVMIGKILGAQFRPEDVR